jgi:hypothetical protein
MRHLGEMLFDIRRSQGNVPLTLWKSDIADAYRLLPMHPLWQIKQIITVDNQRFVDRNLAFGSSGSPGIFISFNSLVAWIAKYVKLIKFILGYVDDSSGSNKRERRLGMHLTERTCPLTNAASFFSGMNLVFLTKKENKFTALH